jgi:hypothetical protein
MKRLRFAALLVVLAVLGIAASAANAAYFLNPGSPPTPTCTVTDSSLSTWVSDVQSKASGSTVCLAAGTYTGPANINRTATGTVTAASAGTAYGAVINGGVDVTGATGGITFQGLNIENAAGGVNRNDCFQVEPGVSTSTAPIQLRYSKVGSTGGCYRNGVVLRRPAQCSPTPCSPPTTGYSSSFLMDNSYVQNVGQTDTSGSALVARLSSTGSGTIATDTFSNGPNDVMDLWGNGWTVKRNYFHGFTAAGSNHNDVLQSWNFVNDDAAEGLPLTNLVVDGNLIRQISGTNAHFFIAEGTGYSSDTLKFNDVQDVGTGSHIIIGGTAATAGNISGLNVWNNTFYNTGHVEFNNATTGLLENNIFQACQETDAPWLIGTGTVTVSNNIGSGATGCTATGTNASNRTVSFVSVGTAGSRDLHLATGEAAFSGGTGSPGGTDIDGVAEPQGTVSQGSDDG